MVRTIVLTALLLVSSSVIGCNSAQDGTSNGGPAAGAAPAADEGQAAIEKALAGLSADERAAAVAQKVCPVSDEPLGSMGTPVKVPVGERNVFICCEGCRDELQKNSEKYLAKLPQ